MNIGVLFSSKFLPTEMTLSVSVLLEVGLKLVLAFKGFPAVLPVTLEVRAVNSRNVPPKASGQPQAIRTLGSPLLKRKHPLFICHNFWCPCFSDVREGKEMAF